MRKRLMKSFLANEKEAMAAMARRWASPRYVQDMWQLLAKLEGELKKDAAENAGRVGLIILNNQGRGRLDPEVFREAARRKALEARAPYPNGNSE
jgi:predicted hydrolase (HD superfamily)